MPLQIPEAVLKCVATMYNLITADRLGKHSTKVANMDHLCQPIVRKDIWDNAKLESKWTLDLMPGRTTALERLTMEFAGLRLKRIKQQRGLRALNELIKLGKAFDPTLNLPYDLAADKDRSYLTEDYLTLLRSPDWSGMNRLRHKQAPLTLLKDLTYACTLHELAGPIAIAQQVSVVMIAHLIWCEDCWDKELRKTKEELPRPQLYDQETEEEKNGKGDFEDNMRVARNRLRSAKTLLVGFDKGIAKAMHWIESDVEGYGAGHRNFPDESDGSDLGGLSD